MQPTESIASLTDRSSLSASTCAQLAYAFCRAAQHTDLSRAATDRYQAWAVAFVSWCRETAPHHVGLDRIGAFERLLRERPGMEEEAVHEALDALAFLFGAVENVESILPSGEAGPEKRMQDDRTVSPEVGNGESADKSIQSLRIGWQDETDPADAPSTTVYPSPQRRPESSNVADAPDEENGKERLAETWIQQYQSQLTSVHATNDPAAEAPQSTTRGREADTCSA